jgi:hypothetical protein
MGKQARETLGNILGGVAQLPQSDARARKHLVLKRAPPVTALSEL